MLFAATDVIWPTVVQTIVQALIAAIVTIILAWMSQRTKDSVDKSTTENAAGVAAAVAKTEEVKATLEQSTQGFNQQLGDLAVVTEKVDALAEKQAEAAKVGEAVHTLVNSNMGIQLKLNAELSRWKAEQTRDPRHISEAESAEAKLKEHEAKQATVDNREPT